MNEMNHTVQPDLPNSTTTLVLGILSIVICWCYGIVGAILGIIGLVMGNKAIALYKQSPGVYSEASYKNVNAGRICSIIGLAMSALLIIWYVILLAFFGTVFGAAFLSALKAAF